MSDVNEVGDEVESEIEKRLEAAKGRHNFIADRVAKAAGFEGQLRPGKIVRLKSGGPPMTIAVFDVTDGLVDCHYFWRGRTGQARYCAEMLEPCGSSGLESLVPPTKPGVGDEWDEKPSLRTRARDEKTRGEPGGGDKVTRVRGNKTQEPEAKQKRKVRAMRELTPEEQAAAERKERNRAWRETVRNIVKMKRAAKARRERETAEFEETEPDKHVY
jgi:uncharacterized protein YodC (DUF2158 family)